MIFLIKLDLLISNQSLIYKTLEVMLSSEIFICIIILCIYLSFKLLVIKNMLWMFVFKLYQVVTTKVDFVWFA